MEQKMPIRILIVDDDEGLASWMHDAIAELGSVVDEISSVTSYEEAVRILTDNRKRPVVLVTDMKLPGGHDGVVLGKLLRNYDNNAVIVCITGYPNLLFRRDVAELPVDYFLLKPFTGEQLKLVCLKAVGDYFMRIRLSRCIERRISNYEKEIMKLKDIEERTKAALSALLSVYAEKDT